MDVEKVNSVLMVLAFISVFFGLFVAFKNKYKYEEKKI